MDEQLQEAYSVRNQKARIFLAGFFPAQEGFGGLCSPLSWSLLGSGFKDFTQEKSVFCRIR